jgi:hypothetical protein
MGTFLRQLTELLGELGTIEVGVGTPKTNQRVAAAVSQRFKHCGDGRLYNQRYVDETPWSVMGVKECMDS